MKRQITFALLAVFLVVLLAPAAWAQSLISGFVKDVQGNPVAGATVELVSEANGRKYNLKTDKSGGFRALGLQTGVYKVTLLKDGQTLFQTQTRINFGENTLNLDLKKEQAQQVESMSPEQKKAIEEQQKEAAKIKGLNDKLAAAKAAEEAGNPQQAVQILSEATQIDATQPVLWVRLADAERSLAKQQTDLTERKATYTRAVEDYKKAIALKPQGAFYNNMGDALAKSGDFDGAIAAYKQAAAIDPPNAAMYYFNEGAVLTNSGKVELANEAFDKAIAADPTKAEAYYQKGVNLLGKATVDKSGKMIAPPEASQALSKYLELSPNGPNAESAKQLLATLGATIETSFGKAKATGKKK
jgi:tetratricopeptide (TPR) repeat protein